MTEPTSTPPPVQATDLRSLGLALEGKRISLRDLVWEKPVGFMGDNVATGCRFGAYSYLNRYSIALRAAVGRYSSLADHSRIGLEKHPVDWVSTHCFPYFNLFPAQIGYAPPESFEWLGRTTVGNDVWIGSHCVVMPGVTIGDGAIVGAGSVVTADVPPYAIVVGTPARVVRSRFADPVCADLAASAWWDYDWPAALGQGLAPPLRDPAGFLSWLAEHRGPMAPFRFGGRTARLDGGLEVA